MKNDDTPSGNFFACPAIQSLTNNIFSFNSAIKDKITIDTSYLDFLYKSKNGNSNDSESRIPTMDNLLGLNSHRKSSFTNYVNVQYNLSWIFFADESLIARFTPPYLPNVSPCEGAILSPGEFDIGSWYRPFNLDYHIPLNTQKMIFEENMPLFYLDLKTEKKVVFKRYTMTSTLFNLKNEFVQSPERYGGFKSLLKRYEMSKKASLPQYVLSEIRKNLVD